MSDFHKVLQGKSRAAAFRVATKSGLDSLGQDLDDYQSIFMLQVLESLDVIRGSVSEDGDVSGWVTAVLQNKARTIRRKRIVRATAVQKYPVGSEVDIGAEEHLIQRDLLRGLRRHLSQSEWFMLTAYAANDCRVSDTWEFLGKPGPQSTFYKRMERLRGYCRAVLNKITK